jgi:glycosyltransferase involved in cell wall biosynthesis
MSKRVLLIAYQFPPVGGGGVQRTVKFAKYLPAAGWTPSVLTVKNPSVPNLDHSLCSDLPNDLMVCRANTWEPGYGVKSLVSAGSARPVGGWGVAGRLKGTLRRMVAGLLQPDAQVLWAPSAIWMGRQRLREVPHDAILATAPPYSSFLVGAALSRQTGLPLVLDFRDEWTISNSYSENKRPGRIVSLVQERMQRHVLRRASLVLATTESSARALERVCDEVHSTAKVSQIYNGFDPDDFPSEPEATPTADGIFRLAYIGTLWNLTSVEPLVEAMRDLASRRPAVASRIELIFVGRRTAAQEQILDQLHSLPCRVVRQAYLDHTEATRFVRSADALCALLTDTPGAERVVPGKVFEYMASKRPIFAIAPRGELWKVLEGYPAAHCLLPGDIRGIADRIMLAFERRFYPMSEPLPKWDGAEFNRRNQARRLAAFLDELTAARPHASAPVGGFAGRAPATGLG